MRCLGIDASLGQGIGRDWVLWIGSYKVKAGLGSRLWGLGSKGKGF